MSMQKLIFTSLTIVLMIAFIIPSRVVNAQDTTPSGPVYIVQEGDSLWDIAYRFHVSQADWKI
jgi:LysM repeat protein